MNEGKRGRPSKKENILIKDDLIFPYYIIKDNGNYVLHDERKSNDSFIGHYTSLSNALRVISKKLFIPKTTSYNSLQEYISEYNDLHTQVNNLYKQINI